MSFTRGLVFFALACVSWSTGASTFKRVDLDYLADTYDTIVLGEVVDLRSRWNAAHNFIFTDVQLLPLEFVKGKGIPSRPVTVTLMGGTVGERTKILVGSPTLEVGKRYVMFLGTMTLPGAEQALSVPAFSQGVFEVRSDRGHALARSQALGHELMPDARGESAPPGGASGIPLDTLLTAIRERAARRSAR